MNWGTEIPQDESARVGLLDRTTVPWHVGLGAAAQDAFVHNPLTQAFSSMELFMARNPWARGAFGGGADAPPQYVPQDQSDGDADTFIDPKTLNSQYGQSLGLTFDQPQRKGAVAIMARRKADEIDRQAKLQRAPSGIGYGLASLATQLAVSATDPINIASAFIPVVGEARGALWTARYGKTAGRALTGVVEGTVGAAAIEPLNFTAAQYLGDDYGMGDSLLNIALGGALGGGLHVGFGKISDRLNRLAPETREGALRGAIANMAEGRSVEIDHILAADTKLLDETPATDTLVAADRAVDEGRATAPAPSEPAGPPRAAGLRVLNEDDLRKVARDIAPDLFARRDELRTRQETFRRWLSELGDTQKAKAEAEAPHAKEIATLEKRLEKANQKNAKKYQERLAALRGEREAFITEKTTGDNPDMAKVRTDLQAADFELRDMGEQVRGAYDQARERLNAEIERPVAAKAQAATDRARTNTEAFNRGQERSTAVPEKASERGDAIIKEAQGDDLDAEHAEALAQIDALEAQGALTPAEAEAGRGGAEDLKKARADGKAAKAAARCLLLHP